jgi:outer membrane cobalamin receptor
MTKLSTRLISLAFLCASQAALAGPAASAERATADDVQSLDAMPLEDLMQMQVVTAASKFEQLISDAPSSVVVLTAADIREFGWRTLADALATLPGLYVTNDRNYSYLGARGFLRPGDYNSRFLLLVDGVRINDAVYDQALIGSEGLVDMDMVKRIEFVPGPGSAVYGSNALFGVINVVTRDGSSLPRVQAAVAGGSQGERKTRASYGWHGQNGADLLLAASSYTREGRDLYYPEFDTPEQNHGIAHGLDDDRAQNLLLKASYGGWQLAASHVRRTKGVPTGSFGAVFNTPNSTRDTQSSLSLAWTGQVATHTEVAAQLAWGRADYLGLGWYPGDAGAVRNVDGDHARWYELNLHATFSGLPRQKLVVGIEAGRDARRDQYSYNLDPITPLLDDRRSGERSAVFVEDEIRLPAGFLVNAGLRIDRRSRGLRHTSPRVALLYKMTPADTIKLIYGSAFRAPNAYEMYYAIEGDSGSGANPNLQPERITTRELVLEHALAGAGHATLSLYQYSVSDLINQQLDPDSGMLVFRNLDHANARGMEAALERQLGGARLRASFAWQQAHDRQGAPLIDSPRHLAKINLVAPLPRGESRLGMELLCSAARLGAFDSATGGYCTGNLTLNVPRVLPMADLSLSLFNAFDKRYADIAGPAFEQAALARQGRSVVAKLAYRF